MLLKIFTGKESKSRARKRGQERRESRGGLSCILNSLLLTYLHT